MSLNDIYMQRMGLEKQNRIDQMPPDTSVNMGNLLSAIATTAIGAIGKRQEEKARQTRTAEQLSNFQKMMEAKNQMPDNSSSAKAIGTLDDDVMKRQRGVISVSDYVPELSMSQDETGANKLKTGYRLATPAEQKAQFEMQKSSIDMKREQAKSYLLSAYVRGDVQEGAILGEMATLGIKPEEFDIATQARDRMRQISSMQMSQGQPTQIPTRQQSPFMQEQPRPIDALREKQARLNIEKTKRELSPQTQSVMPQSQAEGQTAPFRFKTDNTIAEQKFEADQAETSKKAQLESNMVRDSAQDTLDTIDEIEKGIKYFGAAGNIPAFPAEYSKQNWQANVDKLRSNLIVDLIMRMKRASQTGATGFGQLSDKERQVLENAATALRKGLSEEDAQRYLNDIKGMAQKILGEEEQSSGSGSVPSVGGTFNGEKVISVKRIR